MDIQNLYLSSSDDLTSLLDQIRKSHHKRVLIVLPRDSKLLTQKLSFVLLNRALIRSGKQAALVTQNKTRIDLAREVGLLAFPSKKEANLSPWPEGKKTGLDFPTPEKRLWPEKPAAPENHRWLSRTAALVGLILALALLAMAVVPRAEIYYQPQLQSRSMAMVLFATTSVPDVSANGQVPMVRQSLTVMKEGSADLSTGNSPADYGEDAVIDQLKSTLVFEAQAEIETLFNEMLSEDEVLLADTIETDQILVLGTNAAEDPAPDHLLLLLSITFSCGVLQKEDLIDLGYQVMALEDETAEEIEILNTDYHFESVKVLENGHVEIVVIYSQTYLNLVDTQQGFWAVRGRRPAAAQQQLGQFVPLEKPPEAIISPAWFPWIPLFAYQVEFIQQGGMTE